jgi:Ser-tRNA(Ala) deacylase AlaX
MSGIKQNQVYLTHTYAFECNTIVVKSGQDEVGAYVVLADNIFHPQGGGQVADVAWVNDEPVRIMMQSDGLIAAYTEAALSMPVGTPVHAKVDAHKRCHSAALHTGGHFLNWHLRQYGWQAIKGHHFAGESRVEFTAINDAAVAATDLSPMVLQNDINALLQIDTPIVTLFEDNKRISLITGTENMPCGGTHTDNLQQLCEFTIKSIKHKKGVLRISYDVQHAPV